MARTRNIKPAFFDNDVLGDLEPLTRLLFIGLWCIADREGRLEDRPRKIKKALLGYDDVTVEEASGMLQQLADSGFIIRYQANEEDYIQIVNFSKHQNPHMKEKASEIPPPPGFEAETSGKHHTSTRQAPCKNGENEDETPDGEAPAAEESTPSLQEQRFAEFWTAYPLKKAKQTAWRAWSKIKPTAELFEKIMAAIDKSKRSEEWTKENGRFIPHPATWLNGGRWDDEMREVTPGGSNEQPTGGGNVGAAFQGRKGGNGTPAGFKSE